MRRWAQLSLVTAVLLAPLVATAQPADPVADAAARGEAAFAEGRYQAAVDAYIEAYQLEPLTTLLFNIAFIYDEHLKAPRLARTFYLRYAESPDPEPNAQIKAYKRITAIDEALLRAEAQASADAEAKAAQPVDAPVPVTKIVERPASTQQTIGYIALGTGGVALITGIVLTAVTASTVDDFDNSTDVFERRELGDQGRNQAIAADVSIGVGLALAATGAWLLLNDSSDMPAPVVTEDGAGLSWSTTF